MRNTAFTDDPEDLSEWSMDAFVLFLQMEMLDFARRYYRRKRDDVSLRKSEEIRKLLILMDELGLMGMRELVSAEVLKLDFELREKRRRELGV